MAESRIICGWGGGVGHHRITVPPLISFKGDKNVGNFLVKSTFKTIEKPGTFKCARSRYKTCPFVQNADKISGPKRSVKITQIWFINGVDNVNRPFPNYLWPLFQSESWCSSFHMKMCFICMWMKTNFHMKGWAPRLALKKRPKVIRKWSIDHRTEIEKLFNLCTVVNLHYQLRW